MRTVNQRFASWVTRGPRWVGVFIGIACVVAGVALTLRPFTSVEILVWWVAIAATTVGATALAGGRIVTGAAWMAGGAVLLIWPSMSVDALSTVAGIGLVVHGAAEIAGARAARSAAVNIISGVTSIVVGAVAVGWPDVTVLVVAVLFGLHTIQFGLAQIVGSGNRPSDAPKRHLILRSAGLLGALALAVASVVLHRDDRPLSAFYDTPATLPDTPGALIRSAKYTGKVPTGADAELIMYTTQDALGRAAVATAIVLTPRNPPAGPQPVIVWTHGTVGIDRRCAPSLSGDPFGDVPLLAEAVERGWIVVATDYAGMGTEGVSPYLIGLGEAYSALDSVRAVHQMTDLDVSPETIVWGHSQGGHAALWTGLAAPTYAPELTIGGVAALAPATDLVAMADVIQGHLGGALGSSFVISSYSGTYSDVDFDAYVRPGARTNIRETAKRCLSDPSLLFSIVTSLPASQTVFATSPTTGPAGQRLAENTPSADLAMPLIVVQGTADEVIPHSITLDWAAKECAAGHDFERVDIRDGTHMSILGSDSPLSRDVLDWTEARLRNEPAPANC